MYYLAEDQVIVQFPAQTRREPLCLLQATVRLVDTPPPAQGGRGRHVDIGDAGGIRRVGPSQRLIYRPSAK